MILIPFSSFLKI